MEESISNQEDEARTTMDVRRIINAGPWVLEVETPGKPLLIELSWERPLILGSGRAADVRIDDRTVSGRHCSVVLTKDGIRVQDLGSKNGVFVCGARVDAALLVDADSAFVIGRTTISAHLVPPKLDDQDSDPLPGVIGRSAAMRRVAAVVRRHARSRAPLLIQGESGTGKDVIARAVHQLSLRSGSYVPLNAGAITETLAEAELFGHCRGAFTGAVANREGAFREADRGTLFLDEVAELSHSVQVKLLRVVEDGTVRPVGAVTTMQVDARIVSATWKPLAEAVNTGKFRADLYHRLAMLIVELPPLRQRKNDIAQLAESLLARISEEVGEKRLSSAALSRLLQYAWPGNVRELSSVLYRAAIASPEAMIWAQHIDLKRGKEREPRPRPQLNPAQLLDECSGNVSAAARRACVPRSTFRGWLAKGTQHELSNESNGPQSENSAAPASVP